MIKIEKKFKVRVCLFSGDKYTVDYTSYYFIPVYSSLCFWFEQTLTGGTECWSTDLFSYEEAEKIAVTLKSMDDVNEYHKSDVIKRNDFYRRKKEYYEKNVPYTKKYFN